MAADADLLAAFDPEAFRAAGHALVDQLADYLASAEARAMPVLPPRAPAEMDQAYGAPFPEAPAAGGALAELMARVIGDSNHLHHPRYVGHQVTAPLPTSVLGELGAALLNNSMAVFEMGPSATAMERAVLRWMAGALGLPAGAGGVLTSGGSIGNLTALLAARRAKAGFDVWTDGSSAGPPLSILVGAEAHYCILRSAQIMGLGKDGVISVPVDERHRLRPDALEAALSAAEARGRRVIAVVGSACSTATGAFDPLPAIADFCAAHDLWFHVDAAHGGAAALSPAYRHLTAGIERADSVVWDAHKMLLQPALVTAVLFSDSRRSAEVFAQTASYLFDAEDAWWDVGQRTLECTKRMMALTLYASLHCHGTRFFSDYVTRCFDQARRFAALLDEAPDFQLGTQPACNIVCFRHTPAGVADLDTLQLRIRQRLLADGSFYLVQTRLPSGLYLRTTLINPLTTDTDLAALVEAIRAAA